MNLFNSKMNFFSNKTLQKYFKQYLKDNSSSLFDDNNKNEIAFVCKLLFSNGSDSEEEIQEENIINNDLVQAIWFDSNQESKNYSFIKIMNRNEIINDDFSWIDECKKYFLNSDLIETINNILGEDDSSKAQLNFYVVNTDNKAISNKKNIEDKFKESFCYTENDNFKIFEIEDLIKRYSEIIQTKLFVESGELKIDNSNEHSYLRFKYKDNTSLINDSYIFSISAKSLKKLYDENGSSILNLNLRFFKSKKDVDTEIKNSIQNPKYFWQYNNGLVIMCDSISIKNDLIKLKDFSIINGGQTTYNISKVEFENDFYLIAKIICVKDWAQEGNNKESFELANNIAVASNRQKPINKQDLIANLSIVNELKQIFLVHRNELRFPIYLETKSGSYKFDSINQDLYEKSQVISVDKFLQLNWCFEKIKPGTAKNNKKSIYENENKITNSLTQVKQNYSFYSELMFLFEKLNKFKNKTYLEQVKNNKYRQHVLKNCIYFNISLIRFIFAFFKFKKDGKNLYSDYLQPFLSESKNLEDFVDAHKDYFKIPSQLFNGDFKKELKIKDKEIDKKLFDLLCDEAFVCALESTVQAKGTNDSEIHNIVKTNEWFCSYLVNFIKEINRNTYMWDQLKSIFAIN